MRRSVRRICIGVALLSTLLYIRTRLAGLIYNHANGGEDGKYVQAVKPADHDPFANLIKGVVHKLESGQMSDINRVEYHGVKQDKIVVMGRQSNETTEWVMAELPDWQHAIYSVDDTTEPLHTALNKGNEANVYLTYIIDHYDNLPSIMAFIHGHHRSWHIDFDKGDNGRSLQALNLDFVRKAGFANLRCQAEPGCPGELQPWRKDPRKAAEVEYGDAWMALFNLTWVPVLVAAPCCAQFAVSREQVLQRSRDEYVWFHRWLMETPLPDDISGRIFEYIWHVMFGRDPVHCPGVKQCRKDVYNIPFRRQH